MSSIAVGQNPRPDTPARFPITHPYPQVALQLPAHYPVTASDASYDLFLNRRYPHWSSPPSAPSIASDSIRTAVESRGRAWFTQLREAAPDALHMEDAGRVSVVAGEDSVARRLFDERLATVGLSAVDRAYALHAAVAAFTDTMHSERLSAAETYATALDRITDRAAGLYVYRAHLALALAYSGLDRQEPAMRHAFRTMELVGRLPISDRREFFNFPEPYLIVAHGLQSSSNGRQRMDSLNAALHTALQPFPGMTAADSAAMTDIPAWTDSLDRIVGVGALLGKPAPAIQAHTWINMQTPSSAGSAASATATGPASTAASTAESAVDPANASTLQLNDGTVRLVLFGNVYCCIDGMTTVQRLQGTFPQGVSALVVTAIAGYVNGQLASPHDEVATLRKVYRDDLHLTFPIAIWGAPKRPTEAGGFVPEPSPNLGAYSASRTYNGHQPTSPFAQPYVAIVDGHGIVRHVFVHGFTRDDQQRAMTIIRGLVVRK